VQSSTVAAARDLNPTSAPTAALQIHVRE